MLQTDWYTPNRTAWEFKCPGPKGGNGDENSSQSKEKPFECGDCGKRYSHAHNLDFHKLWSCKKRQQVLEVQMTRRPMSSNMFSVTAHSEDEISPRKLERQEKVEVR